MISAALLPGRPHVAGSVALLYSLPCTLIDSLANDCSRRMCPLVRNATSKTRTLCAEPRQRRFRGRLNVYDMKYLHAYCISNDSVRQEGTWRAVPPAKGADTGHQTPPAISSTLITATLIATESPGSTMRRRR
ncbi:MAG: hypothetical protein IPM82_24115 [Saprospiraceae bacterium]|nr:hypothetical protein [Saprospiraceae bacterium]